MKGSQLISHFPRFNLPVLNYTVCTAPNLEQVNSKAFLEDNSELLINPKVYEATLDFNFWEGHSDTDINMLDSLIQLPIWQVYDLLYHISRTTSHKLKLWSGAEPEC